MDNKNIFAANLKRYMKEQNKSRRDVCDALGISYFTLTDWVNGKKYPRMNRVEMLANYFGIQKSDLIEDKTQKEKPTSEGGLSEGQKALIAFARTVPEEKAEMILQVMKTILQRD